MSLSLMMLSKMLNGVLQGVLWEGRAPLRCWSVADSILKRECLVGC